MGMDRCDAPNIRKRIERIRPIVADRSSKQMIPARYNDATELEVQVQPGANTFDFALESE